MDLLANRMQMIASNGWQMIKLNATNIVFIFPNKRMEKNRSERRVIVRRGVACRYLMDVSMS